MVLPKNCDDLCRDQLFLIRQMRLGMGSKSLNLGRVAFSSYPVSWPSDVSLYKNVEFVPLDAFNIGKLSVVRGIYLADPNGFIVMAWPARPDPQLIMKDLDKIMKFY